MQIPPPNIRSFAYRYGIIISIITISFSLMLHFMGLTYSGSNVPRIVNLVVTAACIIIAIVSFRTANGGLLSLVQAVKLGIGIALISAIITVIYVILFTNVIEPDFVEKYGNEVTAKKIAEGSPQMASEQIQEQVDMLAQFYWIIYPITIISSCFYGLVVGVVTGLFTKRSQA